MAKTELIQMSSWNLNPKTLQKLQNSLQTIKKQLWANLDITHESSARISRWSHTAIKDETIVSLQKELKAKKEVSIEDLFLDTEE